jgi:hypothetical protein
LQSTVYPKPRFNSSLSTLEREPDDPTSDREPHDPTLEREPYPDASFIPLGEEPSLRGRGEGEGADDIDGILPIAKSSLSLTNWASWSLPGHGEAYDDCGTLGFLGCLDTVAHAGKRLDGVDYTGKVYIKRYKRNCGRAECPVDFETWASKEAHRATRRLEAFQKTVRGGRSSPIHVIVSPSQGDIDTLDYKALRERAYKVMKRIGVFAGIVLIHPFRRNRGRKGNSWYLSPHFHVLGFGWVSHVGESYQETGYIVKNLGVRQSVYATLQYQLSHAGVYMKAEGEKGKKATITWFGSLSYNQFHYEDEPTKQVCPICEQSLHVVEWQGVGDPPLLRLEQFIDLGEYFVDASLDWRQKEYFQIPE